MGYRVCKSIFIFFIVGFLLFSPPVSAADNVSITVYIVGEGAQTRFDNPLLVAGIWHCIDVTIENQGFQELSIRFYDESSTPALEDRNETNYYEWKYDVASQEWTDLNEYGGYSFIDNTSCQKEGNIYSFCVGVHTDTMAEGQSNANWTLDVYTDDTKLESFEITVEQPKIGIGKSHFPGYIHFYIDPFTEMDATGNDYFELDNTGNTPLYLDISYGTYGDILEVTNFNIMLSDGEDITPNAVLHSKSWQPGRLEITDITGYASLNKSYIIRTDMISAATAYTIDFPFRKWRSNIRHLDDNSRKYLY